ncbi:hypothetical protein GC207_13010 [bacterium]|nr:hypothetical protein [bacterium]
MQKRTNDATVTNAASPGPDRAMKEDLQRTALSATNCNNYFALFQQVWVVNLRRRPDRLNRFWNELRKVSWPFVLPAVFPAIEGDKVGVPKYWQTGGGSYGCFRSHMTILERAIQEDIESLLVLEDDAIFGKTFSQDIAKFLRSVPDDWQCLMIGGQHINSQPIQVAPGIVRAGNGGGIQRTHCYALRGQEVMKALYKVWANAAVHCDWVMGPCMSKFRTYAPDPFLVGQADGTSDISGQVNPSKFWRPPVGTEPVIVLRSPRSVMEALRDKGWHSGYSRDPATGFDTGLRDIFRDSSLSLKDRNGRLKSWIEMIQWEVVSMVETAYCTMWHPEIDVNTIRRLVRGNVVEICANSVDDALAKLPGDISIPNCTLIPVALLRAPKCVMDELRIKGWHNGHWRDPVSGQDNGLRQILVSTSDESLLREGIQDLIRTLHDETRVIVDGVVTIWHSDLDIELLKGPYIQAAEIVAQSSDEAIAKWRTAHSSLNLEHQQT